MGSDPKRREALERARDHGELATTERITLVRERDGRQFGFLVFAPVYSTMVPPETVDARRELLRGFLIGVFRLGDIVEEALKVLEPKGVDVAIYDDTARFSERTFYAHPSRAEGPDSRARASRAFRPETRVTSFQVGQRRWLIECSAAPSFMANRSDARSPLVLTAGLALGASLSLYLFLTARQSDALRSMASALEERNEALDVLNQVISSGHETHDLSSLLRSIVDSTIERMDFDFGGIYLDDEERQRAVELAYGHELPESLQELGEQASTVPVFDGRETPLSDDRPSHARFPIISAGESIGTLIAGRRHNRVVTEAEQRLLRSIGHQLGTLVSRTRSDERIKAALAEKEILLQEIHHRVKNNLQVVSSLLALQLMKLEEPSAQRAFRETQQRVHSMALVHEQFYQSNNLDRLNYLQYMRDLVDHLLSSYEGSADRVSVDVEGDDVRLPLDKATLLALIVNELVSNALEHAFPGGRKGRVCAQLRSYDEDHVRLVVSDDGVGLAPEVDFRESKSLGLRIVSNLAQQLDGTLALRRDNGTEFTLAFRI